MQGVLIAGDVINQDWVQAMNNWDYWYQTQTDIYTCGSQGIMSSRVGFYWDRMQPTANGPLDTAELGRLDAVVNMITAKGMNTILDPHNYGEYKTKLVGVTNGWPNSMFADFWSRLATHYKGNSKVIFGLMNEPIGGGMTPTTWCASSQTAINGIRATGATNLILVPSTNWMHPVNFIQENAS
ncbi:glycoside hydrolase family 5 protein, partial [Francisella tularensis]|uniref:glycoside hydrolase family 5 protein n=1 Tax=Francisella tularensis TaxID=263 RepID=UPI001C0EC25B